MSSLERTAALIRHADRFFIDGQWVVPSTMSMIDVTDSGTEQVFLQVAQAEQADMSAAVGAALRAFDEGPWPILSHAERAEYLRAFAAG